MQVVPQVPVGEMFSPAEGDLLLHGKLQKMNGPVPDVTASSPTTTVQPHLATGLVQLTNGDFISLMWSARLHTFKFTQTSEVVVAFAGGVWYPGVVKTVVSQDTAIISYLHPTSHTVPLPESTEFRFPAKEDTMETDATSVFENNVTCEPTSTSCRTLTLSQNVSSINTRYALFARLYNIPL